ncbi:hypothetical protein [Alphaproteobacteria bacterium endosymbiont of Tiliacea citrago]|uniref:hypothetical protein n=1 Tax=Alphaproteobacteria bacterium endosymbiont of Tiliacea citrago TaxID=3077944 RepID=UPI00313E1ABC
MKKRIGLFVIYLCIHSFAANPNKIEKDDSDRGVILNQSEFEEDQNITISSFEIKIQLKAEAFYEELLNDQPIATKLQILLTDLIFYKDLLKKTNNDYYYLLIYEQIILLLKNCLSFSEKKLRNLSINNAPSLYSIENQTKITIDELMKICQNTLNHNLEKTLFGNTKNNKYKTILNQTPTNRLNLIKEIPENQENQIEQKNQKNLLALKDKEKQGILDNSEIEQYKLLKNLESNKKRRSFQNTSQEAELLNNAQIRLLQKMQNPDIQEPPREKLEEFTPKQEQLFFIPSNKITTFKQATEKLSQLMQYEKQKTRVSLTENVDGLKKFPKAKKN